MLIPVAEAYYEWDCTLAAASQITLTVDAGMPFLPFLLTKSKHHADFMFIPRENKHDSLRPRLVFYGFTLLPGP